MRARSGRVPSTQSGPESPKILNTALPYLTILPRLNRIRHVASIEYGSFIRSESSRIASSIWHGAVSGACEKAARAQDYALAAEKQSLRGPRALSKQVTQAGSPA